MLILNFREQVEEAKKIQRRLNIGEIRSSLSESWAKTKIYNHIEKFDGLFTYEDIVEQIKSNDVVASMFCKDPSKQNISEKMAEKILGISKLPASGARSIRFTSSGDLTGVKSTDVSKSADFLFNGIYFTQKYTTENGGAQDNQYNDVVDFLVKGSINNKVGAMVDGKYWDKKRALLKEHFKDNPNVVVVSIDDLIKKEGI